MRFAIPLMFCLTLSVCWGCKSEAHEKSSSARSYRAAVPTDAQDIVEQPLGNTEQVLFRVRRQYPSFAFTDEALAVLAKTGWTKCVSSSDTWTSFVDATSDAPVRIYQRVMHLKRGNSVILLSGRYTKNMPKDADVSLVGVPDNDLQIGNIVFLVGADTELAKVLEPFGARC